MDTFSSNHGGPCNEDPRLQARNRSQESDWEAARLERKRALDRKSQNAMRERKRHRTQLLEQRLASCEESVRSLTKENELLEVENCLLREKLALAERGQRPQWQCSNMPDESERINLTLVEGQTMPTNGHASASNDSGLSNSTNQLHGGTSDNLVSPRPSSHFDILIAPAIGEQMLALQGLYQALPYNSKPVCLSDGILDDFIKAQVASQSAVDDFSSSDRRPNILPLFVPKTKTFVHPVSQVAADILKAFTDIATLPEQVAGLYLMFKLLNWRIKRTQEAYEELPEWLRPIPLQLRIPHPAWMDCIPWPRVRADLISRQDQYNFEEFSAFYSSALTVSWPYNAADVAMARSPFAPEEEGMVASPIFEQHLEVLKNWRVGRNFATKFPILGAIIMENE